MKTLTELKTKDLVFLLNRENLNFEPGSLLDKLVGINNFPTSPSANHLKIAGGTGIIAAAMVIDILWAMVEMFATGITLTSILIGSFGLVAGLLGILYAANNYKKNLKTEQKNLLQFKTSYFKLMLLEELKKRQQAKFSQEVVYYLHKIPVTLQSSKIINLPSEKDSSTEVLQKLTDLHANYLSNVGGKSAIKDARTKRLIPEFLKLQHDQPAKKSFTQSLCRSRTTKMIGEGIALASVLFASFFWSSSAFAAALGLTSVAAVLSGPIGIGIAVGVCTVIGVLYARHVYVKSKMLEEQKKLNIKMTKKVSVAQMEYELIKNDVKLVRQMQSEVDECNTPKASLIIKNSMWKNKTQVSHRNQGSHPNQDQVCHHERSEGSYAPKINSYNSFQSGFI